MARGAASKEAVMNQILATFEGAFKYDKEIRVPMMENGELIQVKVTLTAAKTNVEPGEDVAVPGKKTATVAVSNVSFPTANENHFMNEPTEEEKQRVAELVEKLGLN